MTVPQEDKPWAQWTASAMLAKKPAGWWRRNVWGLLLILPAVAVVVAVRWGDIYDSVLRNEPLLPMHGTQQEWLSFNGAQMRLAEFGPATGLVGSGNRPFALPDGITAWKGVIEFQAPDQEAVQGCDFVLEDAQGRLYGDRPDELSGARGLPFPACTAPSEQKGSTDYSTTVVFVMASDAQPAALRIVWRSQYPRYARLRVTG